MKKIKTAKASSPSSKEREDPRNRKPAGVLLYLRVTRHPTRGVESIVKKVIENIQHKVKKLGESTVKVTDYEKVTKYIVDFETVDIKGGVVVDKSSTINSPTTTSS